MRACGVAAAPMYPAALDGVPALRKHLAGDDPAPGASALAGRLLTLPVYPTLSASDARRVRDAFRSAAGEAS